MPKKILFESAIHHLASAAHRVEERVRKDCGAAKAAEFAGIIRSWAFQQPQKGVLLVKWSLPNQGEAIADYRSAKLYEVSVDTRSNEDEVALCNQQVFNKLLGEVLSVQAPEFAQQTNSLTTAKKHEQEFHDEWAASVDVASIDVRKINEACTSPELRYIHAQLGDVRGKKILDFGCGLGEVALYFAIRGAEVTAVDLSPDMIGVVQELAKRHNVIVRTHVADLESASQTLSDTFDVVYLGNVLHHCSIKEAVPQALRVLRAGGTFVSWDPVAYNPIINVYRKMANQVRTSDEHPLTRKDVQTIFSSLNHGEATFIWFSTLIIFILFFIVGRVHPNRERYWKKIVYEEEKWRGLYTLLARLDGVLLRAFPPLRWLCWNVVIMGRKG